QRRKRRDHRLRARPARRERAQVRRRQPIDVVVAPAVERDEDQDRIRGTRALRREDNGAEDEREKNQEAAAPRHYMMSFGSVGSAARETLLTGLVMMNPRSVLSSRRKPTCTLRSFRKLPPSELPASLACVNTGKNAPPRTR